MEVKNKNKFQKKLENAQQRNQLKVKTQSENKTRWRRRKTIFLPKIGNTDNANASRQL